MIKTAKNYLGKVGSKLLKALIIQDFFQEVPTEYWI